MVSGRENRRLNETNEHFAVARSIDEAEYLLGFRPRVPSEAGGQELQSLRVFVRDHRKRDVPMAERVLEAHYGAFVLSQSRPGRHQARTAALSTSYGPSPQPTLVAGHEGRTYDLGPPAGADDPDGRMPAVLTWCDDDYFYLIASTELRAEELVPVADAFYGRQQM